MKKTESDEYSLEKWNMADAYLKVVRDFLDLCQFHRMKKNASKWYDSIIGLYIELQAKLTDKEREKSEKLYDNLKKVMKNINKAKTLPIEPFMEFELFLRRCLEKKNMLTPKSDDPAQAYRNG